MSGERWRMVEVQDDRPEHVSSVVLAEHEVDVHLELEARLHEAAGWRVTRGDRRVTACSARHVRTITVRRFDALDDTRK